MTESRLLGVVLLWGVLTLAMWLWRMPDMEPEDGLKNLALAGIASLLILFLLSMLSWAVLLIVKG